MTEAEATHTDLPQPGRQGTPLGRPHGTAPLGANGVRARARLPRDDAGLERRARRAPEGRQELRAKREQGPGRRLPQRGHRSAGSESAGSLQVIARGCYGEQGKIRSG